MSGLNFWEDQLVRHNNRNAVSRSWLQTFPSSASCLSYRVVTPTSLSAVSSGRAKQRQYILQILTKFLFFIYLEGEKKEEEEEKGAVSWSSLTKWHAFIAATSSLGMSLYLSQLSFALLFRFWQEKTGDMKHPHPPPFLFSIFDKACEEESETGGVPFFSNRQPTKT